jgi:hypothetical protein
MSIIKILLFNRIDTGWSFPTYLAAPENDQID